MNPGIDLTRREAATLIAGVCGGCLLTQNEAYAGGSNSLNKSSAQASKGEAKLISQSTKQSISKKGVCGKGHLCELTNTDWYYNWNWSPTPGKFDAEFVPTIKGKVNAGAKSFAKIEKLKKSHGVTHLLGFNEPDSESQGNTSVERAIELWPKLEATELRLGSPAVTDNKRGRQWFDAFMAKAAAKKLRIDFIAVHLYPNITGPQTVKQFFNTLDKLHRKYRRPIWITEFSGLNFGGKTRKMTPATNLWFMRQTLPRLEQLPYIERYAWFASGPKDVSDIYERKHTPYELNPLGKFYRSI